MQTTARLILVTLLIAFCIDTMPCLAQQKDRNAFLADSFQSIAKSNLDQTAMCLADANAKIAELQQQLVVKTEELKKAIEKAEAAQ